MALVLSEKKMKCTPDDQDLTQVPLIDPILYNFGLGVVPVHEAFCNNCPATLLGCNDSIHLCC